MATPIADRTLRGGRDVNASHHQHGRSPRPHVWRLRPDARQHRCHELFLNLLFVCAACALVRAGHARRWLLIAGSAAGLLGGVAMLRNAMPLVEPVAALNNAVLPLWMLVLGVAPVPHYGAGRPGPCVPSARAAR
jgi:hypothetical protein